MHYPKYTFLVFCSLLLASCSWVKDDVSDCPKGIWLQLEYTYNMLDVDAASKQIDETSVFFYDSIGNTVKNMQVSNAELQKNDYRIEISDLPEGDYSFVVWSGLSDTRYSANTSSAKNDFRLKLTTTSSKFSGNLKDLFYGSTGKIHVDNGYAVHTVSMCKDVNRIVCLVEAQSESDNVDIETYEMELVADNTTMNSGNRIVSSEKTVYSPYVQRDSIIKDADFGERRVAEYSFATMRLMANDNARLILKQKDTGYEVFNIPASQYIAQIASLYEVNGRTLTPQEYLDRQDLFTFVFCLSSSGGSTAALFSCKVNNWYIRENGNIKF